MNLLKRFYSKMNSIEYIFNLIKTKIYYKLFFKEIGDGSILYKPLKLFNSQNIIIGKKVYIYKQVRMETIEKWKEKKYSPKLIIEDKVSFEQGCHIICSNKVKIGKGTIISAWVYISDTNHEYEDINISVIDQSLEVRETIIDENCFIGMGSRIMPGTKLGKNCIIGTNSVVSGEFPDGCVIAGIPGKILKKYNYKKKKWEKITEVSKVD